MAQVTRHKNVEDFLAWFGKGVHPRGKYGRLNGIDASFLDSQLRTTCFAADIVLMIPLKAQVV